MENSQKITVKVIWRDLVSFNRFKLILQYHLLNVLQKAFIARNFLSWPIENVTSLKSYAMFEKCFI